MPWVNAEYLASLHARIAELKQERDSERERSDSRISELERRVDWQADMLLRRAQTFPVPTKAEHEEAANPPPPKVSLRYSPDDVGKAQAIRDEGLRLQSQHQCLHDPPHEQRECVIPSDAEINNAVMAETGMSLADLRTAEFEMLEESQSVS